MTVTRRTFAAGAAAGILAAPFIGKGSALAADFTLKLANNSPLSHPTNVRSAEAVARIKEETGGRVDIQIFPQNQLGTDTDTLSQLRAGGVELFFLSPLILATFVPNASLNGIGFAWSGYDKVWPAMDGPVGAFVRGQIEERGLIAFDKIWDNGFRQTTSSTRPIATPADYENFKIRVPVSPLWTSMFTAFGCAPVSINVSEVYTALQTGIVQGQENPLAIISTFKFYEVQKYISTTNHMWDGFWLLTSNRFWRSLPEDIQGVISKHFNASADDQRADIAKLNATLRSELEGHGLAFNAPDPLPFQQVLAEKGFYAEWKGKFGDEAWAILEAATGAKLG